MVGSSICGHVAGEPSKKFVYEVISLDDISRENNVLPDIIKLDLQGYEIEALKGCKELLKTTELFMIEFGCLDAYLNRASVRDLIDLMFDNDYCLYDISDLAYRPYDNALTGGDFFFLKNSSKLRSYKAWK
ncbi:MAG: FkbM family methyltransferase [Bacteroidota bacterium]|nr:FkbM family methyltransferase [Bacteroidota bacterium]